MKNNISAKGLRPRFNVVNYTCNNDQLYNSDFCGKCDDVDGFSLALTDYCSLMHWETKIPYEDRLQIFSPEASLYNNL